jgi:hypothetical protein
MLLVQVSAGEGAHMSAIAHANDPQTFDADLAATIGARA